jgi:hypothetical protein
LKLLKRSDCGAGLKSMKRDELIRMFVLDVIADD